MCPNSTKPVYNDWLKAFLPHGIPVLLLDGLDGKYKLFQNLMHIVRWKSFLLKIRNQVRVGLLKTSSFQCAKLPNQDLLAAFAGFNAELYVVHIDKKRLPYDSLYEVLKKFN